MSLIRNHLPSGLTKLDIGEEAFTQRDLYHTFVRPHVNGTPKLVEQSRNGVINQRHTNTKHMSVLQQLLPYVDETWTLYPEDMKGSIERYFVESVKSFIGQNPGVKLLGGKRCREIMTYMSSDMRRSPPDSFYALMSYLLNANIVVDGKSNVFNNKNVLRTIEVSLSYKK